MKLPELMRRARFVKQGSRMIFVCDLSDLDADDAIRVIEYSKGIIKRMPKKSVLAVAHLPNVKYDNALEAELRQVIDQSDPHVLRGAVSGMTDRRLRTELGAFLDSLGENNEAFVRYEDAMTWLMQSEAA